MSITEQFQQRRRQLSRSLQDISNLTGLSVPQLSNVLAGKVDSRISTFEALADSLDAGLVLVPKHLMPEVSRLLSGKTIGPDDVPSVADRLLGA